MAKIEFKLGKVYPPYAYDAEEGQGTNDLPVYSIDKCVDGVTTHWGAIEVMTTRDDAASIVAALNAAHGNNDGEQIESSLSRYLRARRDGGFGWIERYEDENLQGYSVAMLCGHYRSLLDQLISLVGQGNCEALANASDAISARVKAEGEHGCR